MIGFRQANQAASIAHGCASTLLQLSAQREDRPHYLDGWGIDKDDLSKFSSFEAANRDRKEVSEGKCWLRPDKDCPFSRNKLLALTKQNCLSEHTLTALTEIYRACKRTETHGFR
ncbi:MAG: hypothetical protein HKM89_08925 [Gemmatimonadales bacterium]|nr:hypothetical protein [Gemmatimonadales bacterium]